MWDRAPTGYSRRSSFLSGTITVYASDQCEAAGSINAERSARTAMCTTADGMAMASVICNAAHADGAYTARQQAFNANVWVCQELPPTATNTIRFRRQRRTQLIPPTNTTIPPTQSNSRAIASVRLSSTNPGELSVVWDAPGETARDYRVSWAKVGEAFRTWTDLDYNAFPTAASLTISGLDGGSRYKVIVRARYVGSAGPWTVEVEADVLAEASLPPTNTAVPPTNTAVPPTNTAIPPDEHTGPTDKYSSPAYKHSHSTDHTGPTDKYSSPAD